MNQHFSVKALFLVPSMITLFSLGCSQGCDRIDVAKIGLNPGHAKNLTREYLASKTPVIALAYASGVSNVDVSGHFFNRRISEFEDSFQRVIDFSRIHFSSSELEAGRDVVQGYKEKVSKIRSLFIPAANERQKAVELAMKLFNHAKYYGYLHELEEFLYLLVPASQEDVARQLLRQYRRSVEKLFAISLDIAQSRIASDVARLIRKLETFNEEVESEILEQEISLSDGQFGQSRRVSIDFQLKLNRLKEAATFIMSDDRVHALLGSALNELFAQVANFEFIYFDVLAKTDRDSFSRLTSALDHLREAIDEVGKLDVVKSLGQKWARQAIKAQQKSPLPSLFAQRHQGRTSGISELKRFGNTLRQNGPAASVMLPDNPSSQLFLQAFAAYAQQNFAAKNSPDIGDVYLVDGQAIANSTKAFGFGEPLASTYFTEQVKLIVRSAKESNPHRNLFAIRWSELPSESSLLAISEFLTDDFLVILSDGSIHQLGPLAQSQKIVPFRPLKLTAREVRSLAMAKFNSLMSSSDSDIRVKHAFMAEELAKLLLAIVGESDLFIVDNLCEQIFAHVQDRTIGFGELSHEVNDIVSKQFKISTSVIDSAKLSSFALNDVEEIINKNPSYFTRRTIENRMTARPMFNRISQDLKVDESLKKSQQNLVLLLTKLEEQERAIGVSPASDESNEDTQAGVDGRIHGYSSGVFSGDLADRMARVLVVRQLKKLISHYSAVLAAFHSLNTDDKLAFFRLAHGPFRDFIIKVASIGEEVGDLSDIANLYSGFDRLSVIINKFLPIEITIMFDKYPGSHPFAVLSAHNNLQSIYQQTEDPHLLEGFRRNVSEYFAALGSRFSPVSDDVISQVIAITRHYHENPPAYPVPDRPMDLSPDRFIKGMSKNDLVFSGQSFNDALAPIWDRLSATVRQIEESAGKIYYVLNFLLIYR